MVLIRNVNCFIYAKEADEAKERKLNKMPKRKISFVTNKHFKGAILNLIRKGREIHERILGVIALISMEAKYHVDCYLSLRNTISLKKRSKFTHRYCSLMQLWNRCISMKMKNARTKEYFNTGEHIR